MGFASRRAVARLASAVGAEVQECRHSGRCGFERREARFEHRGYQTRIGAGSSVSVWMKGFAGSAFFALGAPNYLSLVTERCDSPSLLASVPLFIHHDLSGPDTVDWLAREENVAALAAAGLSRREPLFVSHDGLEAVVQPKRATTETLARLADVADRLRSSPPAVTPGLIVDGLRLDAERLPPDLRPLVPLVERWAIGDDVERGERLREAEPEEVKRLVETVGPLLARIDSYLDSFAPDEVPEEAALIGRLAEAVAELEDS